MTCTICHQEEVLANNGAFRVCCRRKRDAAARRKLIENLYEKSEPNQAEDNPEGDLQVGQLWVCVPKTPTAAKRRCITEIIGDRVKFKTLRGDDLVSEGDSFIYSFDGWIQEANAVLLVLPEKKEPVKVPVTVTPPWVYKRVVYAVGQVYQRTIAAKQRSTIVTREVTGINNTMISVKDTARDGEERRVESTVGELNGWRKANKAILENEATQPAKEIAPHSSKRPPLYVGQELVSATANHKKRTITKITGTHISFTFETLLGISGAATHKHSSFYDWMRSRSPVDTTGTAPVEVVTPACTAWDFAPLIEPIEPASAVAVEKPEEPVTVYLFLFKTPTIEMYIVAPHLGRAMQAFVEAHGQAASFTLISNDRISDVTLALE